MAVHPNFRRQFYHDEPPYDSYRVLLNEMNRRIEANAISGDEGGSNDNSTEDPYNTPSHLTDTDSLSTPSEVVPYGPHQHLGAYLSTPSNGYCFPFPDHLIGREDPMLHDSIYYDPSIYRLTTNELTLHDADLPHANLSNIHGNPDTWCPLSSVMSSGHFIPNQLKRSTDRILTDSSTQEKTNDCHKSKCQRPGCDRTFSRRADLRRHEKSIHGDTIYYCGCCEVEKQRLFNRKDKLIEHKRKQHEYRVKSGSPLQECQHEDCLQDLATALFCTDAALKQHMREVHGSQVPDVAAREVDARLLEGANNFPNQSSTGPGASEPTVAPKRVRQDESDDAVKRPRLEHHVPNHNQDSENTTSIVPSLAGSCTARGHPPNCTIVEKLVPDVRLFDFFVLSKLNDNERNGSGIARALMCLSQRLHITFNIPQRMLKLRGCHTDVNELKLKLWELLRGYRLPKDPPSECSAPSAPNCFEQKLPREVTDRRPRKKIFAMDHKSDSALLNVWHLTILPSLPALLNKTIGWNFSATLVRRGWSDSNSRAVIEIQCQSRPSLKIQEHVRSKILDHIGETLSYYRTKVEFSVKPLVLLVGGSYDGADTSSDEGDEEGSEYPHFQRYWRFPGMGASLGLACSDQVSATLGCYVFVDNRPFILTVKHFITAAHKALIAGIKPTLQVMSPPPVERDALQAALEQFIRDIDYDIEETWGHALGRSEVGFHDVWLAPDSCRALLECRNTAQEHLDQIQGDSNRLHLGEVIYQCGSPTGFLEQPIPTTTHVDIEHHMDWALCSVVDERRGLNRHRYQINPTTQEVDFYQDPEGIESHGAGILCSETGPIVANARVHYVGQNTGRQRGQINGAKTLICLNGRTTYESTIIIDPELQMAPRKYCGDSGASVIQDSDSRLVGQLVASIGEGHLVIIPIEAVFQDIRRTLHTENVRLPQPPPPAGQGPQAVPAVSICRTERRSLGRIRVRPSSARKSELKSVARISAMFVAEVLAKTDNPNHKHSIPFLLTSQSEKPMKKRSTFPIARKRPITDDYRLKRREWTWPMMPREQRTLGMISVS